MPTRQHTGSGRSSCAGPSPDLGDGLDVPHLYIRCVDAFEASGDGVRAGAVAEEAYHRFANHPDRVTAALVHLRAACIAGADPNRRTPPDRGGAAALRGHCAFGRLLCGLVPIRDRLLAARKGRRPVEIQAALDRALEMAEAAAATTLIARILCVLAYRSFFRGEVADGFRLLARARSEPEASRDASAVLGSP